MKKITILILSLFVSIIGGLNEKSVFAAENIKKDYLIMFNKTIDEQLIIKHGGIIKETFINLPIIKAEFPYNPEKILKHDSDVIEVEVDQTIKAHGENNNIQTSITKQNSINIIPFTGKGVSVAVLDTGIDTEHTDLKIKDGISFIENHPDFDDDNGHGTHLAGIVAAQDNEVGMTGIAPNVDLYAVKVLDKYTNGKYSTVVKGIDWAIEHNINIVLMSLGGKKESTFFEEAMNKAYQKGILLISSAGNEGYKEGNTITYPAKYHSVIAVGALNKHDTRGFLSSRGDELELMAPGVDILSTWKDENYRLDSGTSMAAAHVAGVAALILEKNPYLINKKVREVMNKTAIPLGNSFEYGNGKINVNDALKMAN
ncbi:S8 family peptidase [Bacillus bingmayongensis]|uniref:S8 family peptidase n=1 Tax=Bacillus bingmayongensis TaxID=1150157 RepID=UPI001C8DCC3E|nr:S8 family peptidase [Bacillus bingmayongensis]MBY0595105.1 S8 family peptidase [Bacillus bingmayongensis]